MQLHTTRAAVRKRARYHLAAALFDKAPSAPARTGLRGNGRTRRRLGPQAAALTDKAPGPCSPVRQAPPFSKTEALCRPFAAGYSSLLSLFQNFLCFLYYRKPRRSCQVPKVARMRPPRASERLPHALEPARFCPCQRRSSSAPQALRLRLLCPARAVPSAVFLPTLLPFSAQKPEGSPHCRGKANQGILLRCGRHFFCGRGPAFTKRPKPAMMKAARRAAAFFAEQGSAHVFRKQLQGPCRRYFYRKEGFYAFDPKRHGA